MVNSSGCIGPGFKNNRAVSVFMAKIFEYSARKNSANCPAAYSTLKPDTSSDSPSVRSKGARFVSARVEMNHIIISGQVYRAVQMCSCVVDSVCIVKLPAVRIVDRRIMASVTSYEIVWAIARIAPSMAYFELEAQPDQRIEYTAILESARINNIAKLRLIIGVGIGIGVHSINARVRAIVGARIKRVGEDVNGRVGSFVNNFRASAIGCKTPMGPTIFGPFRSCTYPNIFRSSSVRNATAKIIGRMYKISVIVVVIVGEKS